MKLHLWGTDFRRSSSDFRKTLALPLEKRAELLNRAREFGFKDFVYLWTCNRVEFYTTAPTYFHDTRHQWTALLRLLGFCDDAYFKGYHFEGKAALRHLVRVACSLESLVIGEPQILGQIKDALTWSKENHFGPDPTLERCFHLAFEIAKRVRCETSIAERPVSLATLSLQHYEKREKENPPTLVAVVGRSPMSRTIIQWFHENRPEIPVLWINRTPSLLQQTQEGRGCELMGLQEFIEAPLNFSHLFTATASVDPIFDSEFLRRLGPSSRSIYDLAEPPDVVVCEGSHHSIFHIQDFRDAALVNANARSLAAALAERMIENSLKEYILEQKEAPILRDFGEVEMVFQREIEEACRLIDMEFDEGVRPRLKKFTEKIIKRNLHLSREHLRIILRQVSDTSKGKEVVV